MASRRRQLWYHRELLHIRNWSQKSHTTSSNGLKCLPPERSGSKQRRGPNPRGGHREHQPAAPAQAVPEKSPCVRPGMSRIHDTESCRPPSVLATCKVVYEAAGREQTWERSLSNRDQPTKHYFSFKVSFDSLITNFRACFITCLSVYLWLIYQSLFEPV